MATVEKGRAVDAVVGTVQVLAKQDLILRAPAAGQVVNGGVVGHHLPQSIEALSPVLELNTAYLEEQIISLKQELACAAADPTNPLQDILQLKLDQLEAKKSHMRLLSPFKGMAVEVYVSLGDWVEPGMPVARILSHEQIVQAELDEQCFQGLHVGQEASLYFSARPNEVFKGIVQSLPAIADPKTRSLKVAIALDLPEGHLLPGMTGQVNIIKGEHPDALLIPRRALWGNQVWVMEEGRVHAKAIAPGFKSLNYVEVLDGLKPGDKVLTDQLHRYHEGQKVTGFDWKSFFKLNRFS